MNDWRKARHIGGDGGTTVILDIPPVRQRENYDCGLACLQSALAFHGVKRNPDAFPLPCPQNGVAPDALEASLRWHGLGVLAGNMTITDLKEQTTAGRPVLCPISEGGGHWVVVSGVHRGWVHFMDPDEGEHRKLRVKDFFAAWWDFTRNGTVYHSFGLSTWKLAVV